MYIGMWWLWQLNSRFGYSLVFRISVRLGLKWFRKCFMLFGMLYGRYMWFIVLFYSVCMCLELVGVMVVMIQWMFGCCVCSVLISGVVVFILFIEIVCSYIFGWLLECGQDVQCLFQCWKYLCIWKLCYIRWYIVMGSSRYSMIEYRLCRIYLIGFLCMCRGYGSFL